MGHVKAMMDLVLVYREEGGRGWWLGPQRAHCDDRSGIEHDNAYKFANVLLLV